MEMIGPDKWALSAAPRRERAPGIEGDVIEDDDEVDDAGELDDEADDDELEEDEPDDEEDETSDPAAEVGKPM
jgi:hypothetical protein